MRVGVIGGLFAMASCSFTPGTFAVDARTSDTPKTDAVIADVAFGTGPFGPPQRVSVSEGNNVRDDDVTLTGDMLEIYFESDRAVLGQSDIYRATRASINDAWSNPAVVPELSSTGFDSSPEISIDGLTIHLSSSRSPSTDVDIYVSTRQTRDGTWSMPILVDELNSSAGDWNAQLWDDVTLYMGSGRAPVMGGSDVFRVKRTSPSAAWGMPTIIMGLDTTDYEGEAHADTQGSVWFTGDAAGTQGAADIWRSDPAGGGAYMPAVRIVELASDSDENDPWISPDGHTIYFTSDRDGDLDIFMATR